MLIKRSRKEKQRADNPLLYAAMAEWFKAVDLKSIDGNTSASSNLACRVLWPVSQEVKMLPFHGGDIGSIPVQAIFLKIKYCEVSK